VNPGKPAQKIPAALLPAQPPKPKDEIKDPTPTQVRHWLWKKENWERCRAEFWAVGRNPSREYQWPAKQWKAMMKIITPEERIEIRGMMDEGQNYRVIATTLDLPWFVVFMGFKKKKIRVSFKHLRNGREKLSDADRMKRLSRSLITEMEERVAKDIDRKELSSQELVGMNKMLMATVRDIEMGERGTEDGVGLTVVTKMPKKEYEN